VPVKCQWNAPCDGCVHAKVCAGDAMACDAYVRFINGHVWKTATRKPTVKATRLVAAADRKQARQDARDEARLGRRIAP
jgi:hypothetical protein